MVSMTADLILASVDLPTAELDRTVAEFFDLSSRGETLPADHFDIDALAAGAEVLAFRLACIQNAAAPLLDDEGPAGHLARMVNELALPTEDVLAKVRAHAGLTAEQSTNQDLPYTLGPSPVYGHPEVRQVTVLDLDGNDLRRRHFVFDLSTGTIGDMGDDEVQAAAAHRLTSADTAA